jgi:hypothetical protein
VDEEAGGTRVSFHLTGDIGVWVAALLTLCIFSFLYKDNPFYRFAEHLFVGVSAGYYIILNFWTVIVPNLWEPLQRTMVGATVAGPQSLFLPRLGDYRIFMIIPGALGLLLFTRLFGKIGWLSRWALAVIIGVYAGIRTTGAAQADFVAQVQGSLQPLWVQGDLGASLNAIVFSVGMITSLLFFFYSREHKGGLGVASKLGIYFLMVSFGAGYGYTVMSRISLLIGRFQFLIEDCFGLR